MKKWLQIQAASQWTVQNFIGAAKLCVFMTMVERMIETQVDRGALSMMSVCASVGEEYAT